jgi:hypothetical protein
LPAIVADNNALVMAGLDPAIHQKREARLQSGMDARVRPTPRLRRAGKPAQTMRKTIAAYAYADRASAPSIMLTALATP